MDSHQPLIIGHRGASALAPENTLISFDQALKTGADGIELDVRLARDAVPVVIHDSTLRRTGRTATAVSQMTSQELACANAGSWFSDAHPKLARNEYALQYVPTLAEVLQLAGTHSAFPTQPAVYVEMKIDKGDGSGPQLVQSVIDVIKRHASSIRAILISFDLTAVALTKHLDPSLVTGALFAPRPGRSPGIRAHDMWERAKDCGADEILLHRLLATRRNVDLARQAHLRPVVWTVERVSWIERAKASGIHALITNNPGELKLKRY